MWALSINLVFARFAPFFEGEKIAERRDLHAVGIYGRISSRMISRISSSHPEMPRAQQSRSKSARSAISVHPLHIFRQQARRVRHVLGVDHLDRRMHVAQRDGHHGRGDAGAGDGDFRPRWCRFPPPMISME